MATETVLRSSGVYTTILGALNQFQAFTDLIYTSRLETTLNYKYKVLYHKPGTSIPYFSGLPPQTPCLKYFGIGTRGYKNIDLNQGCVPFPGDSRMMDLYAPIPFRCVPVREELERMDAETRAKYRMRVVETHNGIEYACYYLKLIDFDSTVNVVKRDADGHEERFDFDDNWLTPPLPDLNEISGSIDTNINRVVVRASGTCRISHDELAEAVAVKYNGDSSYYRISEIGYYTGCDVLIDENHEPLEDQTTEDPFGTEAAYVQLAKGHNFRGSELSTAGSRITPRITFESECCINGNLV